MTVTLLQTVKRYSHIVDPRTGRPVEGVYALTVVAPTATAADALSTAAFVLGPDAGLALLDACRDVSGLVVTPFDEGRDESTSQTLDLNVVVTRDRRGQTHAIQIDRDASIDDDHLRCGKSAARPFYPPRKLNGLSADGLQCANPPGT